MKNVARYDLQKMLELTLYAEGFHRHFAVRILVNGFEVEEWPKEESCV